MDATLLLNGVLAAVLSAILVGFGKAYLGRHRVRVECRLLNGLDWYEVRVHNDAGHSLHVFSVWLERDGRRYTAAIANRLADTDIPPYKFGETAFDAAGVAEYLGGPPARARVSVNGWIQRVFSSSVPARRVAD
jgi:hypothetical protein